MHCLAACVIVHLGPTDIALTENIKNERFCSNHIIYDPFLANKNEGSFTDYELLLLLLLLLLSLSSYFVKEISKNIYYYCNFYYHYYYY